MKKNKAKDIIVLDDSFFENLRVKSIFIGRYFCKHRKMTRRAVFVLIVLFPLGYCYGYTDYSPINEGKISFLFAIEIATLLVIFAVWWSNLIEDWKNSLPKYLNVNFTLNKEKIDELSEKFVFLSDEGDMRQLAQSIGQVKNNGERLDLGFNYEVVSKKICYDTNKEISRTPFILYEMDYPLLSYTPDNKK